MLPGIGGSLPAASAPSRERPRPATPANPADLVQLQGLAADPSRPEIQKLARVALRLPEHAVASATLQAVAAGVPGPLPQMLARVALEAMRAQPDLPTRATIGKTYLEELGSNPVRLATLEDPQAAQTYQTGLLAYLPTTEEKGQATRQKLDRSADPGQNLHAYANGRVNRFWAGLFGLHEGHREDKLARESRKVASEVWAELLADNPKVRAFQAAAENKRARQSAGVEPLRPLLDKVDGLSSHDQFFSLLGELHQQGVSVVTRPTLYPRPDGGPGLQLEPLASDLQRVAFDPKFPDYAGTLFQAAGADADEARALAMRAARVGSHLLQADLQSESDPITRRSKTTVQQPPGYPVAVQTAYPQHLVSLDRLQREVPLEDLKAFLRYAVLNDCAADLQPDVARACLKSNHRIGAYPDMRPAAQTRSRLRPLAEQAFADRVVTPEKRQRAEQVFEEVRSAFRRRLESASWPSEETRREALAKLDTMRFEVGAPPEGFPAVHSDLEPDQHLGNVLALKREEGTRRFAESPPAWVWEQVSTQRPNAFYVPAGNAVMVSAAFMLDRALEAEAEPAELYGAFGYVLAHEMAHAFEASGTRHDSQGRLRDWLTPPDRQFFEMKLQGLARQVEPGDPRVRPALVNEAAADLVGLSVAYDAFLEQGGERVRREGHTPEQRFFLHFATRYSRRDDFLREPDDVHPGNVFRTNVTTRNLPAFAAAFGLAPGTAMALDQAERAGLW